MTEPTQPPADRSGYTLTVHNEDDSSKQTYTVVTREADGVGLGAFSTDEEIDAIIAEDRAYLASVQTDSETDDAAAVAAAGDTAAPKRQRGAADTQTLAAGDVGDVPRS